MKSRIEQPAEAKPETSAVRTSVELEKVRALLDGRYENPFDILGPHEIDDSGRRALAVRAYLPGTQQAWVVHPKHNSSQPMRRIHPAGLYEAICPLPSSAAENTVSAAAPRNSAGSHATPATIGGSKKSPAPKPTLHIQKNGGPAETPVDPTEYQIRVVDEGGQQTTMHDPYAFPPLLTEYDLHLLSEGTHWQSYTKLGAHLRNIGGVEGVNFAVWAPNAQGVSVIGDFNGWDARRHPLRKHIPSGIWELFIPGLGEGTLYKFRVKQATGEEVDKSDPYGFAAELPPRTASKVADLDRYHWHDEQWLANRPQAQALDKPMSFYEVHLGSWRRPGDDPHRWLSYRELAHQLVDYVKEMGYTHIELLPVSEHPFSGSWGYQTVGYYAATSRYGSPQDLQYFVDHCHQNGIGVVVDWVPAHFPKDNHGLRRFDGTAVYEHEDPRKGEHPDWGTLIFNYGRNEVRNFLISNALFWLDKYHLDGLRVDAVASMLYLDYSREAGQWVPNEYGGRENLQAISFIKEFNIQSHLQHPGVLTIAEESTAWPSVSRPTYVGGLGFSLKWNMGWMNDTLRYFKKDPIHRTFHHDELTFSLIYAFHENFVLPLSHDEVVHGKGSLLDQMPGDLWQKFANMRLLLSYMWTHPGKKLLFMGGDFGQWNEWNYDESLQWHLLQWESHQGLKKMVADVNHLMRREPALHEVDFDYTGFEWIDAHNWQNSVLVYLRKAKNPADFVVVACNFTPVPREGYLLGVPERCWYEEVFNSDSTFYGGSNMGNGPGIMATDHMAHGRPHSIEVTLPPLAVVVLKPRR